MHELGLVQRVLELAQECARHEGATAIRAIGLRMGPMSGVMREALEFAFEASKTGTLAEEARLEVEWVSPKARCKNCGSEGEVEAHFGVGQCPVCGHSVITGESSRELTLAYVDVV